MDEKLLQYIWKYQLFSHNNCQTTKGEDVEILNVGEENYNSGPDFLRAKVKIGKTLWAGSVEIHVKSSDWHKHGHSQDKAYDNVVLHVVYQNDTNIKDRYGNFLSTFELQKLINPTLIDEYRQYMQSTHPIVCHRRFAEVDNLRLIAWLDRLAINRLEKRTKHIENELNNNIFNKEEVFYHVLAKSFGFKTNADPMLLVAKSINLNILAKQKDSLLQIEALFFGQAGLLNADFQDDYPKQLQKEYHFLQSKFKLEPVSKHETWHWAKLYPDGQPTIRLAQFSALVHKSTALLSKILEINSLKELEQLFTIEVSPYWNIHYRFDVQTKHSSKKKIGKSALHSIFINAVFPYLFAYASWQNNSELKNKVISFYESIPLENNHIVKKYTTLRKDFSNSLHSQALIELYHNFCLSRQCLQCGIGIHLLKF